MVETYDAFSRFDKSLPQLSINEDNMARNLVPYRERPSEAMVTILRGTGWVHPEHGPGHDFVKHIGREAIKQKCHLIDVALRDPNFSELYEKRLTQKQRDILGGRVENYTGSALERARINLRKVKNLFSTMRN